MTVQISPLSQLKMPACATEILIFVCVFLTREAGRNFS